MQSRERVERCGSLAETSIGNGQASIDPCRTGLLLQRLSFEERGLFITTGIEVSAADSDQTIRAGWTLVEAGGLAKMPDGCLRLAGERIKPAAAFPGPGESRIERQGPGDESACCWVESGLLAFEVSVLFYSLHPDRELV